MICSFLTPQIHANNPATTQTFTGLYLGMHLSIPFLYPVRFSSDTMLQNPSIALIPDRVISPRSFANLDRISTRSHFNRDRISTMRPLFPTDSLVTGSHYYDLQYITLG
jgi:hypothetical protein